MWTPQNRKRYDPSRLRYPSEEWAHVARLIPPAKPGGNKRTVDVREVMNGVMYVLSTGCQWRRWHPAGCDLVRDVSLLQILFADAGYQGRQFPLGSGQGIRGAAQALDR